MYAYLRHFALTALVAAAACNCDEEVLTPRTAGSCEPTFACQTGFEYRLGECRIARCMVDTDCCPGQRCNAAAGFCADQFVSCSRDRDCDVPGQSCIDFRGGQFCGYPNKDKVLSEAGTQRCESAADCDAGRACVGHRCLSRAPCEGGCEDGEVCDLDSNTCYPAACEAECAPGQIAVVTDPETMSGPQCCKVECECATLPSVQAGQHGWYAALALTPDEALVSTYDLSYGDLVVASFDDEGRRVATEYVDGFPTSGPVVGDPAGFRGGRDEAGPDVGQHTSIVVDDANVVHVAYYDVTRGALAYAFKSGGMWTKTVVDDEGDVGRYTSIAIGPDGTPRIAYMLADGTIGADPMKRAALKYARATSNLPTAPGDWSTEVVDSVALPVPVCGGGCARDAACVDLGMGPACVATTIGCGGCESGQACVLNGGANECVARIPVVSSDDLIEGTGLFASMVVSSTDTPMIAYYDRAARHLRFATRTSTGGWRRRSLDGGDAMTPLDVGAHASLAIGPMDRLGVAYVDATNDDLIYLDLRTMQREIVDDGVSPPNLRLVGADASLIFDSGGRPAIAYQDPTNIDLLYARRMGTPGMWTAEVVTGGPPPGMDMGMAAGFYVSQARRGDTAYISTVEVDFNEAGDLLLDLQVRTRRVD